jgi:hypothetical protein
MMIAVKRTISADMPSAPSSTEIPRARTRGYCSRNWKPPAAAS